MLQFRIFMLIVLLQIPALANCIRHARDLGKFSELQTAVEDLGGVQFLKGTWKLGGTAGMFKSVVVQFNSTSDGLKASLQGMAPSTGKWGNIAVCQSENARTILVRVLKSGQLIYLRRSVNSGIELAQISNGSVGSFYSFNKVGTL